jgi:hypothetical protein
MITLSEMSIGLIADGFNENSLAKLNKLFCIIGNSAVNVES